MKIIVKSILHMLIIYDIITHATTYYCGTHHIMHICVTFMDTITTHSLRCLLLPRAMSYAYVANQP